MAKKFDIIVYGEGIGALTSAWKAAKAGHAVARIARPSAQTDALVTIDSEAFAATFGKQAVAELGAQKVVENRFWFLSANAGSQISYRDAERAAHPSQWLVARSSLLTWLTKGGEATGVTTIANGEIQSMMHDRSQRLQAVKMADQEVIRCRALVIGDGGEDLVRDEIFANDGPESRRVLTASQRFTLSEDALRARLCLDEGEAMTGAIVGNLCGGRPARAWLKSDGKVIELGLQAIAGFHDSKAEADATAALASVAKHPSLAMLFKGASAGPLVKCEKAITGFKYLTNLYGNGWLLCGKATRLSDPLRRECTSNMLHAGALAADAIGRCFTGGDTSKRAMGVYHQLLEDSFVVQNLKAQRNAVEDLEKDPSLMSFYSDFFNRWFGHDTEASLEPRKARNKEFFRNLRNERPVWEFAMGMRKGLKLLRD